MAAQLVDTKRAAEILAPIKESTLRVWRHKGIGPRSFKLGGKVVVYRLEDLESWVSKQYEKSVVAGD